MQIVLVEGLNEVARQPGLLAGPSLLLEPAARGLDGACPSAPGASSAI